MIRIPFAPLVRFPFTLFPWSQAGVRAVTAEATLGGFALYGSAEVIAGPPGVLRWTFRQVAIRSSIWDRWNAPGWFNAMTVRIHYFEGGSCLLAPGSLQSVRLVLEDPRGMREAYGRCVLSLLEFGVRQPLPTPALIEHYGVHPRTSDRQAGIGSA